MVEVIALHRTTSLCKNPIYSEIIGIRIVPTIEMSRGRHLNVGLSKLRLNYIEIIIFVSYKCLIKQCNC